MRHLAARAKWPKARAARQGLRLAIWRVHHAPLDDLIGARCDSRPADAPEPFARNGMTYPPSTRRSGGLYACKLTSPGDAPNPQMHEPLVWPYAFIGQLRPHGRGRSCSAGITDRRERNVIRSDDAHLVRHIDTQYVQRAEPFQRPLIMFGRVSESVCPTHNESPKSALERE